jgi:hypothetical protein
MPTDPAGTRVVFVRDFRAAFRGDFHHKEDFATPRLILASDQTHETDQEKNFAPSDAAARAFAIFGDRRPAGAQTSE